MEIQRAIILTNTYNRYEPILPHIAYYSNAERSEKAKNNILYLSLGARRCKRNNRLDIETGVV